MDSSFSVLYLQYQHRISSLHFLIVLYFRGLNEEEDCCYSNNSMLSVQMRRNSPIYIYTGRLVSLYRYTFKKASFAVCISCRLFMFSLVSPGFSPLCDVSGQVFTKFSQFATRKVQAISISEIEVNVFSFIHKETRIIRNNLLSLEFHLIIDGAIGLYNLCVYIPYGLRKEFLYLVFYVFPGYFRFFTFCVMTGFH